MNIGQIKVLSWLAAALLTAGLSFYVYSFVTHLKEKSKGPDAKTVQTALEESEHVKAKVEEQVDYQDVTRLLLPGCVLCKDNRNASCHHFNWTGKVAPPPPVDTGPQEPPKPTHTAVKELIHLTMVKVDLREAKNSCIFLKYKPKAQVTDRGLAGGFLLHEGEHLAPPTDKVLVEAITVEGAVFAFEGEERPKETLAPEEFDTKTTIVQVGPDGVVGHEQRRIPKVTAERFNPNRTTPLGQNKFVLGSEDAAYISQNYPDILANQVRTSSHKDPKTGKYDGIEIRGVEDGSIAARHGAQDGDVIKSINGHPVSTVQEAISFVKTNQGQYTTWEVVIENKGKTRTVTYHTPQQQ